MHHLRRRGYSTWFAHYVKNEALAVAAAHVEQRPDAGTDESRSLIRKAVEARYTAPG